MGRKGFTYRKRDASVIERRANQRGGLFDSPFKEEFTKIKVKEGDHLYRILPPTWDDAEYYGIDVFVHYGIGADSNAYLCPKKMRGEPCAVCDARGRVTDPEIARALQPSKRVLVWVVDRDDERAGPMLWDMAYTVDKDIAKRSRDKRTGEVLPIDSPDEGFDIEITREGAGLKTKYVGIAIVRDPSRLHDDPDLEDDWLDYIMENPLPDVLQYYDYEYVADQLAGGSRAERDELEEEEDPSEERPPQTRRERGSRRERDEDEERGRGSSRRRSREEIEDDDEPPPQTRRRRREEPEEEEALETEPIDDENAPLDEEPLPASERESRRPSRRHEEPEEDDRPVRRERSRSTPSTAGSRGETRGRIRDRVKSGLARRN